VKYKNRIALHDVINPARPVKEILLLHNRLPSLAPFFRALRPTWWELKPGRAGRGDLPSPWPVRDLQPSQLMQKGALENETICDC
jgi:hypothetical protein